MKKFAATYVFPGNRPPLKNGILTCEDDGTVVSLEERGDAIREEAGVEYHSGILVPGFVNAHCHLELSHLHGQIKENIGMGGFLGQINKLRNNLETDRQKAMQVADRKMWAAGVAAVGDIANSAVSLGIKQKSRIQYQTFVEVFGFLPERAERSFTHAMFVKQEFLKAGFEVSIVPHSAYSVSDPLFELIRSDAEDSGGILSVHNMESRAEIDFLKFGVGPIAGHLQDNIGLDLSHWRPFGKSPLLYILKFIPDNNRLLLVHNTFMEETDLQLLRDRRSDAGTYLVLCPNSNLFIGNTLPPVSLFRKQKMNICLGTDSLASNHNLSVLEEMITLQTNFPEIGLEELVSWVTVNGARALGLDTKLGSFETGKKPGVNLLKGTELKTLKLTERTSVKRLL